MTNNYVYHRIKIDLLFVHVPTNFSINAANVLIWIVSALNWCVLCHRCCEFIMYILVYRDFEQSF